MYSSVKIVNLRVKKVSNHGLAALGQRKKDRVRHYFVFPYMEKKHSRFGSDTQNDSFTNVFSA